MQDREEWMREIRAMVPGALLPRHVYERLATLTGLGAIEWIDSSVRAEGREGLTGRVVAFTAHNVVVLDLDQVSGPQTFPRQFDNGTTQVRVLPRSALTAYYLTQAPGVAVNTAEVWSRDNIPHDQSWPTYGAELTVQYAGMDASIVMPRQGQDAGVFAEFARSLMADLAA